MEKIPEHSYSCYYWLKIDLPETEFKSFVENIEQVNIQHKISLLDGIDVESQELCFKFSQVKPTKKQEITLAKVRNEQNCNKFLHALSKKLDGKLYFNVNHKVIKRK